MKEHVEQREGGLYVAGTRVTLDSIVFCFREGLSAETILGEFETLTLAQVYGAIAYYLDNQAPVDSYLLLQRQRFEEARATAEPLPDGLRRRLAAARQQQSR
jgi:uncharacterized protein (DUF433 family)